MNIHGNKLRIKELKKRIKMIEESIRSGELGTSKIPFLKSLKRRKAMHENIIKKIITERRKIK